MLEFKWNFADAWYGQFKELCSGIGQKMYHQNFAFADACSLRVIIVLGNILYPLSILVSILSYRALQYTTILIFYTLTLKTDCRQVSSIHRMRLILTGENFEKDRQFTEAQGTATGEF